MGGARRPEGRITRGTTGTNRLRRVDRWIAAHPALRAAEDPLVVDLGFGASPTTTLELRDRLAAVRADVEVVGIEIDPDRVRAANERARDGVCFRLGGFEIPLPGDRRPAIVRAFNVLRQYDASEVESAWATMAARLRPDGLLVEGTCDELGRVATWVDIRPGGPATFTISLRLRGLERPSIAAERLPKALIHRNVPGERIHAILADLDAAWDRRAGLAVFGATQRWIAALGDLAASGRRVLSRPGRSRLGELTLPWTEVAPG